MTASWPTTLPQRFDDGYGEAMGDGRLRSQTDTGPGKVRRRSSAMARPLSGAMIMTATELAAFEAFVADDLAGGSLPFTFPKAHGAGTWLVRFADDMPGWTSAGGDRFRVTLALEILP